MPTESNKAHESEFFYLDFLYPRFPIYCVHMAKTTIIPLADRVVVSVVTEKKTLSGIIIPDTAGKERPERGVVTAVGKGRKNDKGEAIPVEVKVGDEVLFSKYGPEVIVVDGIEYYILREDQILAIIK